MKKKRTLADAIENPTPKERAELERLGKTMHEIQANNQERANRWAQLTTKEKQAVFVRMATCCAIIRTRCWAYARGESVEDWKAGVEGVETPPAGALGLGYGLLLSRFTKLMRDTPQDGDGAARNVTEAHLLAEESVGLWFALVVEEKHLQGRDADLSAKMDAIFARMGAMHADVRKGNEGVAVLVDAQNARAEQNRKNASRPRPGGSQDPNIDWNRACRTVVQRLEENARQPTAKRKKQDAIIHEYIEAHNLTADDAHQITIGLEAFKSRIRRWRLKHGKKK